MKLDALKHPVMHALIDALQRGAVAAWSSQFEGGARLFDDGSPRELTQFTADALGHERFTSITQVSADGLEVVGRFHSDQWGDFTTYFRVTLGADGKVSRLDIGQA